METTDLLHGKVCLVTGATSGIGLVTAGELARRGARVLLVGRNAARCEAAVRQVQTLAGSREVEALRALETRFLGETGFLPR